MIEFSKEELDLIDRLSVVDGWDDPDSSNIKAKIKQYLRTKGIAICCYCRVSMHGWHNMTIDPEHILPKSIYHKYVFHLLNLNIACKRCNMGIKRADDSFFLAPRTCTDPFKSSLYTIIHPNLDDPDLHLQIESRQMNTKMFRKYWIVNDSQKGKETYRYFRLEELEVNTLDEVQGLSVVTANLSPDVDDELTKLLIQQ